MSLVDHVKLEQETSIEAVGLAPYPALQQPVGLTARCPDGRERYVLMGSA